jgi:SAM-dependent methyltransferase
VLDLACGTGRVSADLTSRGYEVFAVDSSAEMLRETRARASMPVAQGDAFALPLANASFDAVVALRLVFHFADPGPLLREMSRLVRPGGQVVFDTYRWTPRSMIALGAQRWGDKVYAHRVDTLIRQARSFGLQCDRAEHCFLFSPYLYRRLPLRAVEMLEALEKRCPPGARARIFWRFSHPRPGADQSGHE